MEDSGQMTDDRQREQKLADMNRSLFFQLYVLHDYRYDNP